MLSISQTIGDFRELTYLVLLFIITVTYSQENFSPQTHWVLNGFDF